ncbi:uncharacterized protein LOC131033861 [Cryptomeria japonica]|uniref:uncharacterized protein LOC131033861 n=1 Tax=Cryptomeria japonica TaxID=3369 RepID=UPI0025AD20E3|nr:uncharacterized protein LOC131033861 [Cryptomeria japonica]
MECIGGKLDEDEAVEKVLRSLPKYYSSKVYVIEECKDLEKYTMDQLYGVLTAFEMRGFELDNPKKEVAFKTYKKLEDDADLNVEPNVEGENFVRRLEKGTDKYEAKEYDDSNDETLFMVMKVDNIEKCVKFGSPPTTEKHQRSFIVWTAPHAKEKPNDWVIDSGCSNYIINLKIWNGGSIKFGCEEFSQTSGKGTITIDGKNKTKDVLYVKGLKHNLLNASQMCNKG